MASEASEPAMKTSTEKVEFAPSAETTAAATAASATGPRKNSPGVSTSPTPSPIATSTQTSQPTVRNLVEPESRRKSAQVVEPRVGVGVAPLAVEQDRGHPHRPRTFDVVVDRVTDHRRLLRRHMQQLEHPAEDRLVRFRLAVHARGQDGVDL